MPSGGSPSSPGKVEAGRGCQVCRERKRQRSSRERGDLAAHLWGWRAPAREHPRTTQRARGVGLRGTLGPGTKTLADQTRRPQIPECAPEPWQPLSGQSDFLSGYRTPPPLARTIRVQRSPLEFSSTAGASRVGFIPPPYPAARPRHGPGLRSRRGAGEARSESLPAALSCWCELKDSCKLLVGQCPAFYPTHPTPPALLSPS